MVSISLSFKPVLFLISSFELPERTSSIAKFRISSSLLLAFIFDKFFPMLEVSNINS